LDNQGVIEKNVRGAQKMTGGEIYPSSDPGEEEFRGALAWLRSSTRPFLMGIGVEGGCDILAEEGEEVVSVNGEHGNGSVDLSDLSVEIYEVEK